MKGQERFAPSATFLKIMSRRVETQALDNLRGLIIFPRENIASILPGGPPPLRKAQGMETSPRKIGESSPWGATPLKKDAGHGDACIRAPWRFGGAYRSSGMVRVGTRAGPGGTPTGRGPPQPKSLALASGRYRSSTLRFSGCSAPLRPAGVVSRPTRQ